MTQTTDAPHIKTAYTRRCRTQMIRWELWTLALVVTSLGLSVLLRTGHEIGPSPRYGVVVFALVLIGVWIRSTVKLVQQLDELHKRIFLEAGAMAWTGIFAATLLYPILEKTGMVGRLNHDHVGAFVLSLTLISFVVVTRRYR